MAAGLGLVTEELEVGSGVGIDDAGDGGGGGLEAHSVG